MAVKASATITLIRVDDGDPGANAITGYLTNEAIPVPASPTGVVSSFTHANGTFKIMDGNTVATSGISFTKGTETGMTSTIHATTGYYSISAMNADFGSVTYSAVYKGVTVQKILIAVKNKQGVQGTGISSTVINYATSTSGTVIPTSGWGTTIPSVSANQYLWTRTTINYTSGNPSVSYAIGLMGAQGPQGIQGPQGLKGSTGPTGPPTGITESTTIPSSPYTGMLWRHTGTVSGYITGATYRYNGSAWALYLFHADNISATNLAAISANLGTVNAGVINAQTGDMAINLNSGSLTTGGDAIKSKVDVSKGVLEQRGENGGSMAGFRADKYGIKVSHFNGLIGQAPASTETWAGTRMYQSNADFTISSPDSGVVNILGGSLKVKGTGSTDIVNSLLYAQKGLAVDGPTVMSGDLIMSGAGGANKIIEIDPDLGNAGIELGSTKAISTPFIDFHSTGWTHDYDARIIAEGGVGGGTVGTGNLNFMVGAMKINSNVIVAYGNNTNGHWIKMYDGTMICWGRDLRNIAVSTANGNIFRSGQVNYTYPAAFVGPYPQISISAYDSMTALMEIESRTAFGVMLFKGTSNTNLRTQITWQAIGRWY